MKRLNLVVVVVLLIAVLLVASACTASTAQSGSASASAVESASAVTASETPASAASTDTAPAASAEGSMKVGVAVNFAHPYFDAITNGIKDVMEPLGYEIIDVDGTGDVEKQISDMEDFVAQKCAAIFVEPADYKAIRPGVEAAKNAGIPVISLDSGIYDIDLVDGDVQTDNYQAGALCAEDCIKQLGGKGNIVVLTAPLVAATDARAQGFKETIAKNAPDMKIVAEQAYDMVQSKAMEVMENIIQANKEIDAVFAINEDGAISAVTTLESAGRLEGVKIYSVNGAEIECQLIDQGKMTATAAQQPFLNGQTAAEMMVKILNGETPETKEIKIPPIFVNKDTLSSYTPVY